MAGRLLVDYLKPPFDGCLCLLQAPGLSFRPPTADGTTLTSTLSERDCKTNVWPMYLAGPQSRKIEEET